MRAGLTVSIVAHAVIIGLGFVAFPDGRSLEAENIEALPVDLVSIGDVTDLLKGSEKSEIVPKETPQPKPTVQAETPAPPAEKPEPKPVEAAPPPAPAPAPEPAPPEPPKPEPKPEPEPPKPAEVAALPDPEATIPPAPAVPVEPAKPRPRPTPPKLVEEKPEPKQTEKPKFNPDDIAALLNKQEPTGGGDPEPATAPQTVGSTTGHEDATMTQSEIDALKAKLYRCWNPPVAVREASSLVVAVRITLLPDGSLSGEPQMVGIKEASNPLAQVAIEAAIRAVVQCAPFGDILKPENYALWNQIDFVFDPAKMLGG